MKNTKEVFVIVVTNDYALEDIRITRDKVLAEKLFVDFANTWLPGEYKDFSEVEDYQSSDTWWDDDCRVKVHFELVIMETDK